MYLEMTPANANLRLVPVSGKLVTASEAKANAPLEAFTLVQKVDTSLGGFWMKCESPSKDGKA